MKMKKCQQCGILKVEEEFRESYYQGKKGRTKSRYRICKNCESINARHRTLSLALERDDYNDENLKQKHQEELHQISILYAELGRRGLSVPNTGARKEERLSPVQKALEQVLCMPVDEISSQVDSSDTGETPSPSPTISPSIEAQKLPEDLAYWLTDEWYESNFDPEYLYEVVYESLKAKYRPMISIDLISHSPVYDNTYKDTLDSILKRFDDYEDDFDTKDVDNDE